MKRMRSHAAPHQEAEEQHHRQARTRGSRPACTSGGLGGRFPRASGPRMDPHWCPPPGKVEELAAGWWGCETGGGAVAPSPHTRSSAGCPRRRTCPAAGRRTPGRSRSRLPPVQHPEGRLRVPQRNWGASGWSSSSSSSKSAGSGTQRHCATTLTGRCRVRCCSCSRASLQTLQSSAGEARRSQDTGRTRQPRWPGRTRNVTGVGSAGGRCPGRGTRRAPSGSVARVGIAGRWTTRHAGRAEAAAPRPPLLVVAAHVAPVLSSPSSPGGSDNSRSPCAGSALGRRA